MCTAERLYFDRLLVLNCDISTQTFTCSHTPAHCWISLCVGDSYRTQLFVRADLFERAKQSLEQQCKLSITACCSSLLSGLQVLHLNECFISFLACKDRLFIPIIPSFLYPSVSICRHLFIYLFFCSLCCRYQFL